MVKSAERVIQILEAIAHNKDGYTHGELSSKLNIPKSSLSSLLNTLISREYISVEKEGRRYTLGPQILILVGRYMDRLDLIQMGQPIIRKVTQTLDESTEIAIRSGHEIMIVCKEDCLRPLIRIIQIGNRAPIYATAAGKVILAHQTDEEIDNYLSSVKLEPITKTTITRQERLLRELKAIRNGALGRCMEELHEGVTALASPVFDLHGQAVASIVVPIPTIRFSTEKENRVEEVLRSASEEFSHKLGFEYKLDHMAKDAKK